MFSLESLHQNPVGQGHPSNKVFAKTTYTFIQQHIRILRIRVQKISVWIEQRLSPRSTKSYQCRWSSFQQNIRTVENH